MKFQSKFLTLTAKNTFSMEEDLKNFTDETGIRLNIADFTKQARSLPYFHQQQATDWN